jgi:pimeloyl-ACP methyl ester carboxylesterase
MTATLVFLHGLESGPHGSKYQTLSGLGLGPVLAPDCSGMLDVQERLHKIEDELQGLQRLVLVGSSFGGLMAVQVALRQPRQVAGLVLCAPALHGARDLGPVPPAPDGIPIRVLHGDADDVVPLPPIAAWCTQYHVPLTVVADGHRLQASHDDLRRLVREVWGIVTG